MPHDKNGALLKEGDVVTIRATVRSISSGEEYCNVTLETTEPMYPGDYKSGITLNAKQVEKELPSTGETVNSLNAPADQPA